MSSRTKMLDLLKGRKQFFTLPQRFYSDPAFYEPGPYSQVTEGGVINFVEWRTSLAASRCGRRPSSRSGASGSRP